MGRFAQRIAIGVLVLTGPAWAGPLGEFVPDNPPTGIESIRAHPPRGEREPGPGAGAPVPKGDEPLEVWVPRHPNERIVHRSDLNDENLKRGTRTQGVERLSVGGRFEAGPPVVSKGRAPKPRAPGQ